MIVLTTGKKSLCNKVMTAHNKHEIELLDISDLFLARFFRSVERVKLWRWEMRQKSMTIWQLRSMNQSSHTLSRCGLTRETASVLQVVVWASHEAQSLNHGKVRNLGQWPKDDMKISAADRTGERNLTAIGSSEKFTVHKHHMQCRLKPPSKDGRVFQCITA